MPTAQQNTAMGLYLSMLEEVKVRFDCINVALTGQTNLPERGAVEYCYLQLRMLCELIALGCLVVHGEIEGADSLRGKWSADEIIKRLEKLHPDFYPHPISISFPSPKRVHIDAIETGFLTKADLLKLVGVSGDVLHRGSLKTLTRPSPTLLAGLPGALEWGRKVTTLLSQHRIGLLGGKAHLICVLATIDNNVQVSFAESPISPG
jgi:hypothetical protein